MKQGNVREAALEVLLKIKNQQAYSHLLLNKTIKQSNLSEKDIPLLTEMVYGTIQYEKKLDFYLSHFSNKPLKKLEDWVIILLRITLYQMIYLDRVPDRAAVHEAVQIAKKRGHQGIASMVNGILRSVQRKGLPNTSSIKDDMERIAVETSHPNWLINRWTEQLGLEKTKQIAEANLLHPVHTARVNTMVATVEKVIAALRDEGVEARPSDNLDESIVILKGSIANSTPFKKGCVTIQDEGSMLVGYALNPQENERILDACAAPGGKSTHISEKMRNTGEIISLDIHKHKMELIKQQQERLQITNIQAEAIDARKAQHSFQEKSFDRILVDAPCSGLGVIQRKPDLKWSKSPEDIERLSVIQREILDAIWPLLKDNGLLVYSTCTIDNEENQKLISSFVQEKENANFDDHLISRLPEAFQDAPSGEGWIQLLPGLKGTDGFFISAVIKKGS